MLIQNAMLIQQVAGAVGALLVQNAFGFGSAKSRPIGLGLLFRLLSFGAFLETLQIDHIPHASLHHPTSRDATCRRRPGRSERYPVIWKKAIGDIKTL
jgi:hypothetical protein